MTMARGISSAQVERYACDGFLSPLAAVTGVYARRALAFRRSSKNCFRVAPLLATGALK
jgi:hypothetical protein